MPFEEEFLEALGSAGEGAEELVLPLLETVRQLSLSPSDGVRQLVCGLLRAMAAHTSPANISQQVVPLLVTLGGDGVLTVRTAAVVALGAAARFTSDLADTAHTIPVELDAFLCDGTHEMTVAVIDCVAMAAPYCPAPLFVEWSAAKLLLLAKLNGQSSTTQLGEQGLNRRKETAQAIFNAMQAMSHLEQLPSVQTHMLPTLEALLHGPDTLLDAASAFMCTAMLKERQGHLDVHDMQAEPVSKTERFKQMAKAKKESMLAKVHNKPSALPAATLPAAGTAAAAVAQSGGGGSDAAAEVSGWKGRMASKFSMPKFGKKAGDGAAGSAAEPERERKESRCRRTSVADEHHAENRT
jgi:hypothetical protein